MPTMSCADPTFGLSPQSLALAMMLAGKPPSFAQFTPDDGYDVSIGTFPWFNGRERGIALTIRLKDDMRGCRVIAFGEDRATDALFVEHWDQEVPFNNPTIEGREKAVGDDFERTSFDNGRLDQAMEHVLWTMSEFYAEQVRFGGKRRLKKVGVR